MLSHLYDFMWRVTGLFHQIFPSFPQLRMPADVFGALNMFFIALILGTVPAVRAGKGWAVFLAGVVGVIEVINGINHLAAVVYFREYAPGALTAPFLLICGVLLVRELRRSRRSPLVKSATSSD